MTDTTAPADELDKMREARTAASVTWWETWRYDPDSDLGSFNAGYEEGWQARAASQPAQEPVALQRWGVKWKGQTEPFMEQMPDGYWTPWHIAQQAIAAPPADTARADRIIAAVHSFCMGREWVEPTDDGPMYCIPSAALQDFAAALEREVRKP